jgi:hypothetical protein
MVRDGLWNSTVKKNLRVTSVEHLYTNVFQLW